MDAAEMTGLRTMDLLPGEDYPAQIKRLRARLGLTQAALAERLGVSFPTINRWENGKSRPSQLSWSQILKLAGEEDADRVSEPVSTSAFVVRKTSA